FVLGLRERARRRVGESVELQRQIDGGNQPTGSRIEDRGLRIEDRMASLIAIFDPRSTILNPRSSIHDPQSTILNPRSSLRLAISRISATTSSIVIADESM